MNELDYQLKVQKEVADRLNLEQQLKEANEVIKHNPALNDFYTWVDSEKNGEEAKKYLEKWGVK